MKNLFLHIKFKIFFAFGFVLLTTSQASSATIDQIHDSSANLAHQTAQESKNAHVRWGHAKELLGKKYQKSVVKSGEKVTNLNDTLEVWTYRALRKNWKKLSKEIAQEIIVQSEIHNFDPIFLMAVIENESSFNAEAIGSMGEIGLMQITPQTGKWIAKKTNVTWDGVESLKNPLVNIQLGAAYLSYLRNRFNSKSGLYIAAYNMGATNVFRSLQKQIYPKDYTNRVMQRYIKFYDELDANRSLATNKKSS